MIVAEPLARTLHRGQVDKSGQPDLPIRVLAKAEDRAAWRTLVPSVPGAMLEGLDPVAEVIFGMPVARKAALGGVTAQEALVLLGDLPIETRMPEASAHRLLAVMVRLHRGLGAAGDD